jgi:tripartite-type tricarboxylate transporter receptor subunit TctC
MGAVATHAINPWLYTKMPYDALRDFTPITLVAQVPNVLVMNAETAARFNINTLADLVTYAKKNPGRLNYGSGGNGSAGHLAGETFKAQAGLFVVHIPYAGGPPAQLALVSGQVDFNFDNLAAASANIKSGKLKALAVTTAKRSTALPEVPTVAEAGARLGLNSFDISGADLKVEQGVCRRLELGRHEEPTRHADGRTIADHVRPVQCLCQDRAAEVPGNGQGFWGKGRLRART